MQCIHSASCGPAPASFGTLVCRGQWELHGGSSVGCCIRVPRPHSAACWPHTRFSLHQMYVGLAAGCFLLACLQGQVLNQTSAWWMQHTQHIMPNALLSIPDPNVSVMKKCAVFPVELVVRGFLTGGAPRRTCCGGVLLTNLARTWPFWKGTCLQADRDKGVGSLASCTSGTSFPVKTQITACCSRAQAFMLILCFAKLAGEGWLCSAPHSFQHKLHPALPLTVVLQRPFAQVRRHRRVPSRSQCQVKFLGWLLQCTTERTWSCVSAADGGGLMHACRQYRHLPVDALRSWGAPVLWPQLPRWAAQERAPARQCGDPHH